jgi:sialic acid synthase SpsE
MTHLAIGNHQLGKDRPAFVIAELGVNHDGDVATALSLVDAAAAAGADAIKLQLFRADRLMHPSASFAQYQKRDASESTPAEMLRRYELSDADARRIVERARAAGVAPLATPFSPADVDLIESLDLPAIKIASPDLVNWPLLKRAAGTGRPMLVSTGAATFDEIADAVGWLHGWGANFALMHCVSSYPTPAEDANLCWIAQLANCFDLPVGYSDHTPEPLAGALAVVAGACAIEKHLTHDRSAAGPDHSASADPADFRDYVQFIRVAETVRGAGKKRVLEIEQDVRRVSRQSLVAAVDLRPGQTIVEADLTVQRPGTGIPAAMLPRFVGRKVRRFINAGEMLEWTMIAEAA